jgi:ABC-type sugar transport system ATPase subunit
LCDRVLVIRDGKIRKELPRSKLTLSSLITASVTSSEELVHATD